jgi:cell division protein FtsB
VIKCLSLLVRSTMSPLNLHVIGAKVPTIISWILNELKNTPTALVSIAILGYVVYGLSQDHVGIKDFTQLQGQMSGVQYTLQHDHLDTRQHQVESEIFNLTQHVIDEKEKKHDVDQLYSIRIDELTRQDNDLKHQIDLLDRISK